MSGHPEREGGEGGGGNLAARKPKFFQIRNSKFQIPSFRVSGAPPWVCRGTPKSRFHVSKCADSRILLCKFQIPSFRVSGAPPWVHRGIPKSRFHVSSWADSRILLCKFQIPRFRVCRFQDTPGHIPDSEFPSFRGPLLGPSPRDGPQIPDSEFPSFRGPLLPLRSKAEERDSQIPDSEFPSFRGPLLGRSKRDAQIPRFQVSESNT